MASDTEVTSLSAIPGVGQVALAAVWAAPAGQSSLSYMQPDVIEFWAASSNNRGSASKVGESRQGVLTHGDLSANVTRYYWARVKDPAGNFGPWYPASSTGGVSATTLTTDPGPNSVGSDELQNGAVDTRHFGTIIVYDAQINSVSAYKISASTLSAITANLGTVNAGTINGLTINSAVFTGGRFRTGTFGQRVEINSNLSQKYVAYYNSSGSIVAALGDQSGSGRLIYASGDANFNPVAYFQNAGSDVAVYARNTTNSGNAHGLRGANEASGGGSGLVGTSGTDGGYGFYAEDGPIGPFTGSHPGLLLKADEAEPGDILVDVKVVGRRGIDDTVTEVARSSQEGQRNVIGVLSSRRPFDPDALLNPFKQSEHDTEPSFVRKHFAGRYDFATINGVGEGQMNVCGLGGDIEAGDFICTSDMPGKGQRQNNPNGDPDDFPRRCTVARAREAVTFTDASAVKRIAIVYLAG